MQAEVSDINFMLGGTRDKRELVIGAKAAGPIEVVSRFSL